MPVVSLLWSVAAGCAAAQGPVVAVDSGQLSGSTTGAVSSFKGIPFAMPPVGALRWRAPQPVKPWKGVRTATQYGSDCMQMPFPSDAAPLGTPPAEDCLYANVWRPADAKAGAKLPVMVWIYGGGFVNGGSSPAVYDGSHFAEQGVVLVSFNYRVGRFGFFAHPSLTAENADGVLGNYAFMDQIAAMQWVHRNIAAFGGDPAQVTVFGESAGGYSVSMLLTSPMVPTGLFQRAVIESGGGRMNINGQRYLATSLPSGPESSESIGVRFAASVGITGTGKEALAKLRALPAELVRGDLNMATSRGNIYAGPVIDGRIVTADPQAVYLAGAGQRVPIMIGANSADIARARGETKEALFAQFGPVRDAARAAYDPAGDLSVAAVRTEIGVDRTMLEPARFVASAFAIRGLPSYEYRFSYVADSMRTEWVAGAPHASEIPYVFDTVKARYGEKLTVADEQTAQQMLRYWVAFARSGDPGASNPTAWPAYTPANDVLMDFTLRGPVAKQDPYKARLDVTAAAVNLVPADSSPAPPPPAKP